MPNLSLKERVANLGLTQVFLAEKTGYSQATISAALNNKPLPFGDLDRARQKIESIILPMEQDAEPLLQEEQILTES